MQYPVNDIANDVRRAVEILSGRRFRNITVSLHPSAEDPLGLAFVQWVCRDAGYNAQCAGLAVLDPSEPSTPPAVSLYPSEMFLDARNAGVFNAPRVTHGTVKALFDATRHACQCNPFRLSGPANREMRRKVLTILTGDMPPLRSCGYLALCEALYDAFPVAFTCLADRREKIVRAIRHHAEAVEA